RLFRWRSYFINGIDPSRTWASLSGKCVGSPAAPSRVLVLAITMASLEPGAADETARVHQNARRRGSVAAGGARAAAGDASDRVPQRQVGLWIRAPRGGVSSGPRRSRLRGRPQSTN